MLQHRITNGSSSGRKQQTALKQTVDRPKIQSWHNNNINHRNHPYSSSSTIHNQTNHWLKSSTKIFDDNPELDLTCQEETLTEAQLQNYPTQVSISNFCIKIYIVISIQAYDPTAPLPLPAVRKRTSVLKKLPTQDIEILQDRDEDFIPSESDDDDDDDENYLPEHDRRPYNRTSHVNGNIGRGKI
jgi:hypothetical protein